MMFLLACRSRRWSMIATILHFSSKASVCAYTSSTSRSSSTRSATSSNPRIAVIGGGASGIFASIQAASHGNAKVLVFEGSPKTLGKVKISGGGRCNVLHDTEKPVSDILGSYPRGNKELRGLYERYFTPQTARDWFVKRGVELKTEPDGRMFPVTDRSQTIIDTLLNAAYETGVQIVSKQKVFGVRKEETTGMFELQFKESTEMFDAVVLATGSAAIGHEFATTLGHTIVSPVPSLFTLNTKHQVSEGGMLHGLSGLSVPNARLTFKVELEGKKKKEVSQQEGPLLITHHGVSGPATLRLSAFGARQFHQVNYRGNVLVHWAPELGSADEIAQILNKCRDFSPKRAVSTSCPLMLDDKQTSAIPRRLWANMVLESGFEKETTWNEAPKKKINALARMVSECVLDVTGKSVHKDEFVTAGGVSLKEINMKTMSSKKCAGLFLCGEVIDVDGVTGGFNFMNCWATGYTAGNGAAEYIGASLCASL